MYKRGRSGPFRWTSTHRRQRCPRRTKRSSGKWFEGLATGTRKNRSLDPGTPPVDQAPWLDPAARPFVEIDGVTKTFGSICAVDDLSLSVFPGEFFSLLGGTGCAPMCMRRHWSS